MAEHGVKGQVGERGVGGGGWYINIPFYVQECGSLYGENCLCKHASTSHS